MFKVPIDKIIPVTNARARISSLVNDVQKDKSLYVLTRGGRPAAILASIDYINDKSKKVPAKLEPRKTDLEEFNDTEKSPEVAPEKDDLPVESTNEKNDENVPSESQDEEQPVKISVN